jgi:hypothetical protein
MRLYASLWSVSRGSIENTLNAKRGLESRTERLRGCIKAERFFICCFESTLSKKIFSKYFSQKGIFF